MCFFGFFFTRIRTIYGKIRIFPINYIKYTLIFRKNFVKILFLHEMIVFLSFIHQIIHEPLNG